MIYAMLNMPWTEFWLIRYSYNVYSLSFNGIILGCISCSWWNDVKWFKLVIYSVRVCIYCCDNVAGYTMYALFYMALWILFYIIILLRGFYACE